MKKGTLTKKAVFPLLFALLLGTCDTGVVFNSDAPPEPVLYPP